MKLDVVFTPTGLTAAEIQGRTVFVIDILRATTVMCAALAHGAKALIPVASTEEALRLAQTIGSDDVLLAGERNCLRIPGFQLGNSPLEMREPAVRGKTSSSPQPTEPRPCLPARVPRRYSPRRRRTCPSPRSASAKPSNAMTTC